MILRWLCLGISLACNSIALDVTADTPPSSGGYETIEGLFSAYKKATKDRDWRTLFLLGTPEHQDCDLLTLVVSAATSKDDRLRRLVEKHGADWRQFDRTWAEADNQRFIREYPAIATALGRQVKRKPELLVAAQSYIARKSWHSSTEVHRLENLVCHGTTAVGETIESRTCIEPYADVQGSTISRRPRTFAVRSHLCFRRIDGRWYPATENEIGSGISGDQERHQRPWHARFAPIPNSPPDAAIAKDQAPPSAQPDPPDSVGTPSAPAAAGTSPCRARPGRDARTGCPA